MGEAQVICGDALDVLPTLDGGSFDCVITDPPYPHVRRSYGFWTEDEWRTLMHPCVRECVRVLKTSGSAVFVLQPNSDGIGRMRPWLFDFQSWVCREFGMVQDAYWWNISAIPEGQAVQGRLMRPSVKHVVWVGRPDCWRDQRSVLWREHDGAAAERLRGRAFRDDEPSGHGMDRQRSAEASGRNGGATPFNLLPLGSDGRWSGGCHGHGASTPKRLLRWWVRYICPPGGSVLDPFGGSGTTAVVAAEEGRTATLIEREPAYVEIARKRLAGVQRPLFVS